MPLNELHVEGYRSIRDVTLALGPVNVVVGPNGCGKTNLYRSLTLIAAAAEGRLARTIADEGGMPSLLWAGPRGRGPVRMTLTARIDEFTYELSCGLPKTSHRSNFFLDPEIKSERVVFHDGRRRGTELLKRDGPTVWARNGDGDRVTFPLALSTSESALSELREPHRFPVLSMLRQEILGWRFYHHFRTDAESPLRRPRPGCRTPVLDHEGRDLAAALETIREIGDHEALEKAIDLAFPGSFLHVEGPGDGEGGGAFSLALKAPEFRRAFAAPELSDGTLQYLCLLAAVLSPRPPSLLALNEPETSIHPDLLAPLAALIVRASRDTQVWITTHSEALADHVARLTDAPALTLEKVAGATRVAKSDGSR